MQEKDQTRKSSSDMPTHLKSGEEPTELLLQLAWSAVETLLKRKAARVFVGNGEVAILLKNTKLLAGKGFVPTKSEAK